MVRLVEGGREGRGGQEEEGERGCGSVRIIERSRAVMMMTMKATHSHTHTHTHTHELW